MEEKDKLRSFYDNVSSYLDIGSYDDFYGAMQDPQRRQNFYDATSQYVDIGDSQKFNSFVGDYFGGQEAPRRVDVSDVEQENQPQIPYGDLTTENFVAAKQRGSELNAERKKIEERQLLALDSDIEPSWVEKDKKRLAEIDKEMQGLTGFINEWNKTDGAKAYYDQQKRIVDDVSARVDQMQADRNRERASKKAEEEGKKSFWLRMAEGLAAAENPITEEVVAAVTDPTNNDLRTARNEVRNANNQLHLEELRMNGSQKGLGFLRGMENANYYELMPVIGMADAMSVLQLSKDIQDGKELTDSQKLLKEAMEARAGVDFAYQDNNTMWERIGQSAPEQLMFTAQFVVGAGVTGATKAGEKVAAKSAEKAVKRLADKGVKSSARNFVGTRVLPELEGMVVSSAIQTFANPLSIAGMVEDFEKRYAGDIYYDKQGNLHVFDNDRSAGQAAYQAIASAWIENFTEYAGANITKSAKLLDSKMFDLAGKFDNVMKTVGAGKIQDVFRIPQQLGRLTQIGSAPEEFLEEELGSVMNALMMTDAQRGESYGEAFKNTISSSFAGEQQLETFLSCAITSMLLGGGGNAVNGVRNAGLRKSVNEDVEQSKALLGKVRGINIDELDTTINNGEIKDISSYLEEQSNANNWSKDEQGAAVSYVLNRTRQIGVKHNDNTAIEAEQAEYRRQAEEMVNRWDGQNIYNVTFTDKNGETQEGTIVNGRVHYDTNEDGTYTFNPYMSSGMLAIRKADGSVDQVPGRSVNALNNVVSIEEQMESQNQTIEQMMRSEFDQDGMLPTIESVWGGNLVPNVTQFQDGRYTYLGQDDNGLYAFANNDKKTSKDNPIVYLTERQLIEYGLSLNLENAQANGDTEAAQKAQEDIDFLKRLDEITADAGEKGQWDVLKAYAQQKVQMDANEQIVPDGSNEQATAAYLLAISEGSFENAIASVDQTIAALGQPQQTEVTDDAATNAAINNAATTVDADKAQQIDFYTNVRRRLMEMMEGKAEADVEEEEQVVANTPVSQMTVGQQFPVEWNGQQAVATIMDKDADGRSVVTVRDMNGEDIESGIDDMTDEQWDDVRVQPQPQAETPMESADNGTEQVQPEPAPQPEPTPTPVQPEPAPQQEQPQQTHPLDDFIAKHGENAENKLGVTIDAINKEIASFEKDLEKAEKDLANMPEPYDEKTQKAQDKQEEKITKLRADLDEKRNILAPYAAMQEELDKRKEVRQSRENGVTDVLTKFTERLNNMLHPKRESKQDTEPQTIEEFIASRLRRKGLARTAVKTINKKTKKMVNGWKYTNPVESFDYDSFKQETGLSDSEMKNFNDPIQPFFTNEGGITFGEFVHSIWEDRGEPGVREDISDSEVRDAVIEFFRGRVSSLKDINDYIENNRRDVQAEQDAIANDMIAQQNGYESGEAMENDLIAQASTRADELLNSDTLSDEDVAAFDAELSQRLDNLVPSIEETAEETEPATVENTEDEDFIQPTDKEAPFSITGKSNEQIASEYQKQLDEAETESDRAKVIQEYLDTIGTEPAVVMTDATYEAILIENRIPIADILEIRKALADCKANNLKFNAFKYNGKVYMFSEYQDTIEDARTNYVHERQHIFTGGTKKGLSLLNKIKGLASEKEFERYVELLSGSDFYTRQYAGRPNAHKIYADEFISMAIERAYNGMDLDAELGKLGIKQELINEIKQLDNEQRTDESLAKARRTSPVNESRQGDNGQNGGNQKRESREVGGQRSVTVQRGKQAAERRESVKSGEIYVIDADIRNAEDLRFSTNGTHVISNGKSLVGIHNIGAEKLRKAMKNGGFANPSAAVIDIDKQEHKGYGEVSLIMPSSLVDSRTGRNAGTYAGDAYTPEYPSVSYREGKNTDKLVKDLVKDLPKELGWAIRQGIGEYMDGNRSRSGLEYLFLKERGQEMPIVKNERRYPDISTEQIDKRLGVEESANRGHSGELYAAYEKLEGDDLVDFNMWFEAYGDEEKIKQRKDLMERNAKVKEMLEEQFGEHMGYGKFDTTWYNILRDERDAGKENISRTLEDAAIEIDNQGLRNEFEQWKQNVIDGLGYEEVIFDGYTPSGYRRYVPNTVENASRIMNKKEKTNWLSDAGTHATKAMLLDKFNTLNDIRKNRGLLESDQEVINQAYEEASDAWSELGSELAEMQKVDDNRFINHDIALNRLQEAMMKSNPAAYLNKEYKYNLDEAFNDRIKDVKQQIKSLPSKYFETKFRRPVYLNEFAAAVVPNDLPQDLKERLQQSGLPLFEYDPNKEGDRRAVTLEATEGDGIRFSVANRNQAIFVSNAARAVEGIKQEKATPEQWLKMIEKNGGLKAGEDKWLGLSQWLKDQANTDVPRSDESLTEWAERNRKKTLTKQEVLDFINENMVQVEEVEYGGSLFSINSKQNLESDIARAKEEGESVESVLQLWDKMYGMGLVEAYQNGEFTIDEDGKVNIDQKMLQPINSTRLQNTTEGLDNKREIALTVPTIEPWNEGDDIHFGDAGEGRAVAWVRFGETTDADGKRVLVIDEIQSKRHQEGREKGYEHYLPISGVHAGEYVKVKDEKYADRISFAEVTDDRDIPIGQIEKIDGKYRPIASNGQQIGFKDFDTEQEALDAVAKDYTRVEGIPSAPFEKNWMELAMKRMLRLAAEEGCDKVAWTTGEQQAERYNLGKFYDTIGREDKDDNYRRYVLSGNNFDEIVIDEQNRVVESSVSEAEGKPLSEVVGMDMAVKMENMNDGDELSGNDLRIGGEGMKGFYDKMIPSFMNKYGKQWGVKVGEVTMPNLEEGYQTMHSIDVNEQMKADVMEGQVMFSVKNSQKDADDNQLSLFLQNNTGEYETQDGQTIGFTSLLGAATEADAVRGRDNVQRGDDILSYQLRRLEPGETCHVERRYQKSKMFDFTGSEKIESADDVAYIFNKLEDAAVENSFVVLVKDGKPTIIHTGVGSYGSTYVSAANALVAYKNINPDEVWFVHNHPSGSITSSQPDRDSSKRFEKVFGKKYKGGIIIDTTSGKYGVFDSKSDTGSGSTRNTPSNETDIDVYEFSKQVFDKDWNPETAFMARTHQDIATFVSSHRLGEHDKMSLLVLNNNLNVVGNVFLPYESIGEADIKKLTDDVLYYTNQMAGTQAVIYGSFTADDVRDIKKLANNIANAEGRLVDVISTNSDYTGLRSARLMGAIKEEVQEIKEDEARFSVTAQQDKDYMDAVNRGDMETAQRMVRKAANKSGYNIHAYHSTTKDFNVFKGDSDFLNEYFYFSPKKKWTQRFLEEYGISPENINTKDVFLRADNILDVTGEEEKTVSDWFDFLNERGISITDNMMNNYRGSSNANMKSKKVPFWYLIQYDFKKGSSHETAFKDAFIEAGYDGIHMPDTERGRITGDTYAMFDPNQIKSADPVTYDDQGNVIPLSERFNPNNNDIRFSVNGQQRIAVADEFNRRTGANMDNVSDYVRVKESLIRDWFDGLHPLEQAQKLIEEKLGRKLRDSEKAYEFATQTTSVGAAMLDKEEKEHMIPLLQKVTGLIDSLMKDDGMSREEAREMVTNYLLAKHGLERNEWYKKNGMNDNDEDMSGLRGLAESLNENPDDYKAVAERLVNEFESKMASRSIDINDFWKTMKGLTDRMLEISYESGMIDKDTYEGLKKRHKYYVPLRGFGEGTASDIFDYISKTPQFQDIFKKAKGRMSKADDPLSYLYNMLQSAIVIGNQNKVMQKIYNLAVNSKSDLLRISKPWYVYNDATDQWEEKFPDITENATADEIDAVVKQFEADMAALQKAGRAKRMVNALELGKKLLPQQAKDHEMTAYINGKKVNIIVAGNPLVAQAMNKANKKQLGALAEGMQVATRFMSMINTSLSPAFMLTNSARDIGFALFSSMVTGGFKKTGQMAAWMATTGWVLPRLMATNEIDSGIIKKLGPQRAAQLGQWWKEFVENGGETGFTRTLSAEKARAQVDDMIKNMLNGSKDGTNRLRKSTLGVIETAGRYSEDISRFAAYCQKRANGGSVMESINEAKNITVNFNVKGGGRLAASCRACYSFFNAALQGVGRMARLAKENPQAFSVCLMACVLQGAALPWLNLMFFSMLGGDDDDWEKYKMLTEYTANRNLVLYVGNHKFLKIPYAQELAPFAAMGNIFFRQQMGWNNGRSVASQIGNMFVDLAPINIGESQTLWGKAVKTVTPTALLPLVEVGLNEDFTGSPIYKRNQWNKYDAAWEKAYEGKTSKWVVDASKWLDDKTGVDINPAIAEHLFSGMLGGIGRSGDKLLRYFTNGLQLQDAPFIRTMMFDSKPKGYIGAVTREYGRHAFDELPRIKHDVENMTATELAKFVGTEEFEIANLVSTYKTGKDLAGNKTAFQGIDKMEKEYKKAAGMSDGSEAYREQLEAMKAEITEMKMQMLDEISQIQYEHGNDLKQRIRNRVNEVERESKAKAK